MLAGVFQIESAQAIPAAELKDKYIALLKAQDKTFGYIVRGVRSDGQGGGTGPGIDSIVKVTLDGRESPVRGMRFGVVSPMAFRDLAEASQRPACLLVSRGRDLGGVRHCAEPHLRRARDSAGPRHSAETAGRAVAAENLECPVNPV